MTKADLRAALKKIGYTCSIRANPFKETLADLWLITPQKQKLHISSASVFSAETYTQHKAAFEICQQFDRKT